MESEMAHKKVGRTRRPKATYLPLDLILEILLRLPGKSATKFRCVSKLWSSITTLPSFIRSFAAHSSPRILILSKGYDDKLFVFSIPQNQNSDNKLQVAHSHVITYPKLSSFARTKYVHGLICIMSLGIPHIWNPTTGHFSTLPTPERGWRDTENFLGYDPIDGTYKVLSIPSKRRIQPRVLTLNGPQKSWRAIPEITEHYRSRPGNCNCINGVIYYRATLKRDDADNILVRFHVRSEKMSMIKVPWDHRGSSILFVPYHGN